MKTTTIRLTNIDLESIQEIQATSTTKTINGTIKEALRYHANYKALKKDITEMFKGQVGINQIKALDLILNWDLKVW